MRTIVTPEELREKDIKYERENKCFGHFDNESINCTCSANPCTFWRECQTYKHNTELRDD